MPLNPSLIANSKLWFAQWILTNHDLWSAILVSAPECTPKLTFSHSAVAQICFVL